MDWELELAIVIGKAGRDISAADAPKHIAGYTIFNDISSARSQPALGARRARDGTTTSTG